MNELLIVDLDTPYDPSNPGKLEYLTVLLLPDKLDYTPDSKFVAIESPGRNNPFYHYAGSEDTLEFSINWYSFDYDFAYVIDRVRWLESLTKADAYLRRPPRVRLIWGMADRLWRDYVWALVQAPYTLDSFWINQRGSYVNTLNPYPGNWAGQGFSFDEGGPFADEGNINPNSGIPAPNSTYRFLWQSPWGDNMPAQATQKLVFKRLTQHNLTRQEIANRQSQEPATFLLPGQSFQILI